MSAGDAQSPHAVNAEFKDIIIMFRYTFWYSVKNIAIWKKFCDVFFNLCCEFSAIEQLNMKIDLHEIISNINWSAIGNTTKFIKKAAQITVFAYLKEENSFG